ncbi:carboxymuconolactone decarboxylase family protein [Cytophagaceae bacterium 50C-KIRBA]|uniref:Carboxymuconolactone decarboxylase family protein n=1 Tax=Aquirufa beregesia TaxID=2516556 RepID=A0ABX0F6H6_9BACT|nr:carboxymuconolactone decarboxylase family protein [Aquirufa beregesia]NGZ45480.1 carboxymuconolactone decarboxylase family protein [Aquirufa beregesia]
MAHIDLGNELPGIRGLMAFSPLTEKPLNALAEVLLRGDNSLTRGERELIGTYVSYLNDCFFCQNVHGAMAGHYLGCNIEEIDAIKKDFINQNITAKMKALLTIAGSVQKGGKHVSHDQIELAKIEGASDMEIHDTVLIAASFCMFNRYVDGLATLAPEDRQFYINRAPQRAEEGYTASVYK